MTVLLVICAVTVAGIFLSAIDNNGVSKVWNEYCNMECIERRQIKKLR